MTTRDAALGKLRALQEARGLPRFRVIAEIEVRGEDEKKAESFIRERLFNQYSRTSRMGKFKVLLIVPTDGTTVGKD